MAWNDAAGCDGDGVFAAYSKLTRALASSDDYDPDPFLILLDNGWHTADIWYDFRLDLNPSYVCSVYLHGGVDGGPGEVRLRNGAGEDFYVRRYADGSPAGDIGPMMDAIRSERERLERERPARSLVMDSVGRMLAPIRGLLAGVGSGLGARARHGRHRMTR